MHSVRRYPAFRMLLLGTLATNSAFWMYQVAVGWLALEMTDSPFFVGLAGFAGGIPLLLLSAAGRRAHRSLRPARGAPASRSSGSWSWPALFALLVGIDAHRALVDAGAGRRLRHGHVVRLPDPDGDRAVAGRAATTSPTRSRSTPPSQNATRVVGPSLAGVLIARRRRRRHLRRRRR